MPKRFTELARLCEISFFMKPIEVTSTGVVLHPDSRRVIVRPFLSSNDALVRNVIDRALSLSDEEVESQLEALRHGFAARHHEIEVYWMRSLAFVDWHLEGTELSVSRSLYIGALFSGEYALESAALFNPSIVAHPDQTGVPAGCLRFVLSLRATGEGHISSIEFRSGVVDENGRVTMDPVKPLVTAPEVVEDPCYRKSIFVHKLSEMGFDNSWCRRVMDRLAGEFTHKELHVALDETFAENEDPHVDHTRKCINWLAESNYQVNFPASVPLSQRVIFPVSANESNGIEDARFVRFCDDDASVSYFATYTAYNGHVILPQLIETNDFQKFHVLTLNGNAVQNKGMALFPRRINGRYAMLSRQDDENLHLMLSDNVHFWNDPKLLRIPLQPWEFVKIGNCGSPIETPGGWLVITHGVGPMRRYCIGALLLDLDDPSHVIGALKEPLLQPKDNEREGYVPNVVYSCGALVHGDKLILPYALSDTSSTIGTVSLPGLLARLQSA